MPIDTQAIWKRLQDDANNRAGELGVTDNNRRNAFAHIYVSAQLVREYGEFAAFVGGTRQEFLNHWEYRYGGPEPRDDPHQRRDSFRDLWNNGIGREIGKLAVYNSWTNDQVADYIGRTIAQGVAIVDRFVDPRIPANVGQLSSFDYFLRSQGASVGAIRNLAPAERDSRPRLSAGNCLPRLRPQRRMTQSWIAQRVRRCAGIWRLLVLALFSLVHFFPARSAQTCPRIDDRALNEIARKYLR